MTPTSPLRYLAAAALLLWLLAGCSGGAEGRKAAMGAVLTPKPTAVPVPTATSTPIPTVKASMLVQSEEAKPEWFRGIEIPEGTDAYALTNIVTEGNIKSTFYPEYKSHFVEGIKGIENRPPYYWMIYMWNEATEKWEPLPVASDFFSVKDGHTFAWHYTDTSKSGPVRLLAP